MIRGDYHDTRKVQRGRATAVVRLSGGEPGPRH